MLIALEQIISMISQCCKDNYGYIMWWDGVLLKRVGGISKDMRGWVASARTWGGGWHQRGHEGVGGISEDMREGGISEDMRGWVASARTWGGGWHPPPQRGHEGGGWHQRGHEGVGGISEDMRGWVASARTWGGGWHQRGHEGVGGISEDMRGWVASARTWGRWVASARTWGGGWHQRGHSTNKVSLHQQGTWGPVWHSARTWGGRAEYCECYIEGVVVISKDMSVVGWASAWTCNGCLTSARTCGRVASAMLNEWLGDDQTRTTNGVDLESPVRTKGGRWHKRGH